MKRKIELYGRLRDAGFGNHVSLELERGATAGEALNRIKLLLGRRSSLLHGCALATGTAVLGPAERVPDSGRLAVLPPVCGG